MADIERERSERRSDAGANSKHGRKLLVSLATWLHAIGAAWLPALTAGMLFLPGLPVPLDRVVKVGLFGMTALLVIWLTTRGKHTRLEWKLAAFTIAILLLIAYPAVATLAWIAPYGGGDRWFSASWLALTVFVTRRASRAKGSSEHQAVILLVAVLASLILVGNRGWPTYLLQDDHAWDAQRLALTDHPSLRSPDTLDPHVLHVIADGLAGPDVLEAIGVPVADLNRFEKLGLAIVRDARANYAYTYQSVASMLNLRYLDPLAGPLADRRDRRPYRTLIAQSAVFEAFKQQGYRLRIVGSGFDVTNVDSPGMDCHGCRLGLPSLFEWGLSSVMPLRGLLPQSLFYEAHRRRVLESIETLATLERTDAAPTFTFGHILAPHPPFVMATGSQLPGQRAPYHILDGRVSPDRQDAYRIAYRDEVRWTLRQLAGLAESSRQSSQRPTVIVIQGDHGPGYRFDPARPDRDGVSDRFSIFMAVDLAHRAGEQLPASPVNIYRVIFRQFFNAEIPLLPNRQIIPDDDFPFRFVDVTGRWSAEPKPEILSVISSVSSPTD